MLKAHRFWYYQYHFVRDLGHYDNWISDVLESSIKLRQVYSLGVYRHFVETIVKKGIKIG